MKPVHTRILPGALKALPMLLLAVFLVGLAGCGKDKGQRIVIGEIGYLYNQGVKYLERHDYKNAALYFGEVERQYPYSDWARRSQLMAAYAQYMSNDYDEAILTAQRFLSLHPGNPSAAYAYYLIAICNYEQIVDVGRDQRTTENALQALREVVQRFPNSAYAQDAALKVDLTRDHLAGKEMEVGRWYQKNGYYLAGLLRFRRVIDNFQTTTHVPEALHRLVECYLALGITDEAEKAGAVLAYNFPDSKWTRYSYRLLTGQNVGKDGEPKKKKFLGIF
jgi:outer membrane protein assembly factor BamD